MTDNTTLPGTGDVIASDDIGGVKHQRVKVSIGADGSAVDWSATNPAPVVAAAAAGIGSAQVNVTTAGTRVQLGSHSAVSVTVKAKATNTGLIYVGDVTVASSNGFILSAGDSASLDVTNSNLVYVDSSVSGEGVSYLWVT